MNDVIATEQVFLENQSDFKAREILVELCNALRGPGSTVNDRTNDLTMKLIVGNEKAPQGSFVYPDLKKGMRWARFWHKAGKVYRFCKRIKNGLARRIHKLKREVPGEDRI